MHSFREIDKKFSEWLDTKDNSIWENGTVYLDSELVRRNWMLLKEEIPSAKFIFTTRPLEEWVKSVLLLVAYNWHINDSTWKYVNVEEFVDFYAKQTADVVAEKEKEPSRFLILELGHWPSGQIAAFTKSIWSGGKPAKLNSSISRLRSMIKECY